MADEFALKDGVNGFETWDGPERIVFTADRDTPFVAPNSEVAKLLDEHPDVKRAEPAKASAKASK